MLKKTLALVMTLCLLLAMATGCSSTTTTTTDEPATTPGTADAPATDTATPDETPAEKVGYQSSAITGITGAQLPDGAEASITWQWDVLDGFNYVSLPLTEDPQTISAYISWQNDYVDDPNETSTIQELERRTNVHVDWTTVSGAAAIEQFGLMITSGDWMDVIFGAEAYTGGGAAALEDEVYLELTDIIAENCPNYSKVLTLGEEFEKATRTNDGDIAGFFRVAYNREPAFYGAVMHQHLLDRYNLETPVTLADWENAMDVAMENGQSFGYALLPLGAADAINAFPILSAYDVSGTFYQVDGKIHYGPIEDGFRDALGKLNEWFNKGYLVGDWYAFGADSFSEMALDRFAKEQCLFADGGSSNFAQNMRAMGNTSEDLNCVAVASPIREEGLTNHFRQIVPQVYTDFTAISTTAANPELCAKWLDYRYSNEGKNLWTYGVEGETYEVNLDGTITQAQIMHDARDSLGENYEVAREAVAYLQFWTANGMWYEWRGGVSHWTEAQHIVQREYPIAWTENNDGAYMLPTYEIMTDDLADGYSSILADINTYTEEMFVKFIIGEADLDTQWEEYVAKIESMNIQFCIDAQQRALDAYNAR